MTLTGLVRLLLEQFLLDSRQHYVFENYRQLECYRVPSDIVPEYLRGRPRAVIKHCLLRKTKSNKFAADAVQDTSMAGVFELVKESGGKHTINLSSEGEMPFCSCKDWARWHIPCKHFFAVFRWRSKWSWNTLPYQYRHSPYLSTDSEAVTEYLCREGNEEEDFPFDDSTPDVPSPVGHSSPSKMSDVAVDGSGPETSEQEMECDIPRKVKLLVLIIIV